MFNCKIVQVPRLRNYEGASQQKRDLTSLACTPHVWLGARVAGQETSTWQTSAHVGTHLWWRHPAHSHTLSLLLQWRGYRIQTCFAKSAAALLWREAPCSQVRKRTPRLPHRPGSPGVKIQSRLLVFRGASPCSTPYRTLKVELCDGDQQGQSETLVHSSHGATGRTALEKRKVLTIRGGGGIFLFVCFNKPQLFRQGTPSFRFNSSTACFGFINSQVQLFPTLYSNSQIPSLRQFIGEQKEMFYPLAVIHSDNI